MHLYLHFLLILIITTSVLGPLSLNDSVDHLDNHAEPVDHDTIQQQEQCQVHLLCRWRKVFALLRFPFHIEVLVWFNYTSPVHVNSQTRPNPYPLTYMRLPI